jgi:hypothetical protein
MSAPYHLATRWVRRRVHWELEPRLAAIEESLAALHAQSPTAVKAELVAIVHRTAEAQEAMLQALTDEVADLRRRVRGET